MAKRKVMASLALVACLVAAAIAGFVVLSPRAVPGIPPELVPAKWADYRTSTGHTQHVGKGGVVCKDCHDFEREGFKNPGVAPCARCHASETARSHVGDDAKKTDCLTCHAFAPKQERPACIGCHAERQGPSAAIHTHASTTCTDCHRPHERPSAISKDCASCHTEVATKHASHPGSTGCADCHAPHAPAAAARDRCHECHDGKQATLAPQGAKPAGHAACTTCHAPHDFAADRARVCVGCHGEKPTLMATRVKEHAACTSCHTPHSPFAAAESCAGCHTGIQVAHADKQACITCHAPHAPHQADVSRPVSRCTSCHQLIAASDVGAHAGGTPCIGCHKQHDFAPPSDRRALCATCHASEKTLAATNRGHADCASCHGQDAHRPSRAPACATCHAKERATAPQGHTDCRTCHEPHSGARLPNAATCTSCHAEKTRGPHGGAVLDALSARAGVGVVNGGCETCHRPHGPSGIEHPPACATCHTRPQLPGLHAVAAHDVCTTCHTSHEAPRATRATCTTGCHANRRDHQPQAAVCSGCHVFRR